MMNKLRLQLDDLLVESFDTSPAEAARGTVVGAADCTCATNCSCPGCPTCDETCPQTCAYTCDDGTCAGGTCEGTCFPDGCGVSQWDTCQIVCPYG